MDGTLGGQSINFVKISYSISWGEPYGFFFWGDFQLENSYNQQQDTKNISNSFLLKSANSRQLGDLNPQNHLLSMRMLIIKIN